jgi:hypothetical protein
VSLKLGVAEDVARRCLVRLRGRGLAEDDGARPQAFARPARGDVALGHLATADDVALGVDSWPDSP